MKMIFQERFEPALENVRAARSTLEKQLAKTDLTQEVQYNLSLVFAEITTNLVKHSQPTVTLVDVVLQHKESDVWQLEITDDGGSFAEFSHKIASLAETLEIDDLDQGGMGLYLLNKCFPNHHYIPADQTADGKNHLVLMFSGNQSSNKRSTILIIEDDRTTTMLLQARLGKSYDVSVAHDAATGLDALEKHFFDLLLCDIGLPDKSGLEIRQELAVHPRLSAIPFIFLTGAEESDIREQAYALGVDDYLIKPINPTLLESTIDRVLKRAQQVHYAIAARLNMEASTRLHPKLPATIGAYKTSLFFKEASAGGGDMVLHIPRATSDIIILADVTGHGTEAKYFVHLYTGYIYGMVRSLPDDATLPEMMQALSNLIYHDDVLEGFYLTCQMLEINEEGITFCNGGHLPPFIAGEAIEIDGAMPGLVENQNYQTRLVSLTDNQRLLCYSDGLFEGNGEAKSMTEFEQSIKVLLSDDTTISIDDLSAEIWQTYQRCFGVQEQRDDVTYFILETGNDGSVN